MGVAVVDQAGPAGDSMESCRAFGYLACMDQATPGGGKIRQTSDAFGQAPMLSGYVRGPLCPTPSAHQRLG